MTLNEIQKLSIELMDQHGLIKKGWRFEFDGAKRRFGLCSHGRMVISLSKHLSPLRDKKYIVNTMLHEIAHVLVGPGNGHNNIWKRKAIEIGCDGKRCGNDVKIEGKFKAVCKNGHIHYRHRRSSSRTSCGLCSKSFNPEFLLVFK